MGADKTVKGVANMVANDPQISVTSDVWDKDPLLLGTPDGYVELKTGVLREADPKDLVTKRTTVTPAPNGTPCPCFDKFLDDATSGDEDVKRFLQQFFGYCLTGLTKEQKLLLIHGPGGNGKGLLLAVIADILGDYAKSAQIDTLVASQNQRHLTEIARLQGARFVGVSEAEKGQRWNQARINQMTGGDRVTANFMYHDHFEYQPQFKLMIVANYMPGLVTVNRAARRRFVIVSFKHEPPTPDTNLHQELKGEYPAILRWMIDGCLDWLENGLVLPEVVKQATAEYFEDEDIFGRWIAEKCECEPGLQAKAMELYESWKVFAEANGESPGSSKSLAEMLKQRGFKSKKSGGTIYLAIGLNPLSTLNFSKDL